MKDGTPSLIPLLRMYIVRRVTSPTSGSSRKVAITNSPSGKSSIGPSSTSTSLSDVFVNDGSTAKPSTGSVTRPPMRPPRPSVATERKVLRGYSAGPSSSAGVIAT